MGKRSDFDRVPNDFYRTFDPRAHKALANVQSPVSYYEPCVGEFDLVEGLSPYGFRCVGASDIEKDALTLTANDVAKAEYIITNPPWKRPILHAMINHFVTLKPTWLLFDANWMNTKQSSDIMKNYCTRIVAVGRMKWIPNSKAQGKDDAAWFEFRSDKKTPTIFIGR